ncbi:uncharacterized protein MONOS_18482 [Monocercomonoides exilis]|uniref:uncharacterized protein n=1 Tax=Monocercomonoides exilis TaxID=2049356 RepID=UPI00355A9CF5|nr:hypothetical protein MONOS_18482 [Monocercomonoides exilis]
MTCIFFVGGGGGECGQSGWWIWRVWGGVVVCGGRGRKCGWGAEGGVGRKGRKRGGSGKNDLYFFLWGAEEASAGRAGGGFGECGGVVVCGGRGRKCGWGAEGGVGRKGRKRGGSGKNDLYFFCGGGGGECGQSGWWIWRVWGVWLFVGGEGGSVVGVLREVLGGKGGKEGVNVPSPRPRHFAPLAFFPRPHTKFLKAKIQGFSRSKGKNDLYFFLWGAEEASAGRAGGGFGECGGVVVCGGRGRKCGWGAEGGVGRKGRKRGGQWEKGGFLRILRTGKNDLYFFLWGAEEASAGRAGGGFGECGGVVVCGGGGRKCGWGAEGGVGRKGRKRGGSTFPPRGPDILPRSLFSPPSHQIFEGENTGRVRAERVVDLESVGGVVVCGGRGRKCGWGAEGGVGRKGRKRGGQWEKGGFLRILRTGFSRSKGKMTCIFLWGRRRRVRAERVVDLESVGGVVVCGGEGGSVVGVLREVLGGKGGKEGGQGKMTCIFFVGGGGGECGQSGWWIWRVWGGVVVCGGRGRKCGWGAEGGVGRKGRKRGGSEASAGRAGGGFGECGGVWLFVGGEGGSVVGVLREVLGGKGGKEGGQGKMTCIFFVGGGGGECGQSGWWIWRVWGGVVVCGGEGGSVVGVLREVLGGKGGKEGVNVPSPRPRHFAPLAFFPRPHTKFLKAKIQGFSRSKGKMTCIFFVGGGGGECGQSGWWIWRVWGGVVVCGGRGRKCGWGAEGGVGRKGRKRGGSGKNDLYFFCGGRRRRVRAERVVDLESVGGVVVCGGEGGSVVGVLREVLGGKGGKEGGQGKMTCIFFVGGGGGECGQSGWWIWRVWGGVVVCGGRGRKCGWGAEGGVGRKGRKRGGQGKMTCIFLWGRRRRVRAERVVDLESVGGVVVCGGRGRKCGWGAEGGVGRKGRKRGGQWEKGGFFENTANSIFPKNLPRPPDVPSPRPRHFAPLAFFPRPHTKFLKAKIQGFSRSKGKNDLYFFVGAEEASAGRAGGGFGECGGVWLFVGGEGGSVVGVLREVLGGKGGKEGGQWEKGGIF